MGSWRASKKRSANVEDIRRLAVITCNASSNLAWACPFRYVDVRCADFDIKPPRPLSFNCDAEIGELGCSNVETRQGI